MRNLLVPTRHSRGRTSLANAHRTGETPSKSGRVTKLEPELLPCRSLYEENSLAMHGLEQGAYYRKNPMASSGLGLCFVS